MSVGAILGNVKALGIFQLTIDPASVATITTAEQTFTAPGLQVGDVVYVNKPSNTAGVGIANCRVSAANTLAITFVNPTAGSVDAASEVYQVLWIRPESSAVGVAGA
jgi:hypothetical protein